MDPLSILGGAPSFTGGSATSEAFGAPTSQYAAMTSPFTVAGSGGSASGGVTGNSLLMIALIAGAVFLVRR